METFLVGSEEGGAGEHGEVHGKEVVAIAGEGDFLGLDRAARRFFTFDDGDFPALAGQVNGGCQAVMAGAYHDGIV